MAEGNHFCTWPCCGFSLTSPATGGRGREERERDRETEGQRERERQRDRENRETCRPVQTDKGGGNYNVEGRENRTALTQKSNQKFDGEREREGGGGGHQAAGSAVSRRDPIALKNEVKKITFVPARIYPCHHERCSVRLAAFQPETEIDL